MSYSNEDFTVDALGGCYFLGAANACVTNWRRLGDTRLLREARAFLEALQRMYHADRLSPPLQLSQQATTLLVRHYVAANQLGLTETEIISAMALGRINYAIEEIDTLIRAQNK